MSYRIGLDKARDRVALISEGAHENGPTDAWLSGVAMPMSYHVACRYQETVNC